MGAERFDHYQQGSEAKKAFLDAREDAFYEYGHRGYTGTIAEKDEFEVRNEGRPLTKAESLTFANLDLESNEHSKWGPAWAVAIRPDDSQEIIGWLFYGYASS